MKYLVEPTGNFSLQDLIGRQVVEAYRPTVVTSTPFIETQKGRKLRILEVLAEDAEDASLARARNKVELDKAVAELPRPADTKTAPAPKPVARK